MRFFGQVGWFVIGAALALGACSREPEQQAATAPETAPAADQQSAPQATVPPSLNLEANENYLAESRDKPGTIERPSGLQYRVLNAGSGSTPKYAEDEVEVTYKGWMVDGTVFDQTEAGDTTKFPAGGVIVGWQEALSLMKEGDEWEVVIPAAMAYGLEGKGPIPPNQVLTFQMKLIKVTSAAPPQGGTAP
jgi:FKBP-type peptidyl-prolyl cis-trans isomerase FklB